MTHPCSQGEVDIVEGVNDQVPNASSLHTGPGISTIVTVVPNLVVDRTEITFRMHYAPVSPRNWVSVQLNEPVLSLLSLTQSFSTIAPPPDWTATPLPTAMLVVVCKPPSQTTMDRRSTPMAADGA